jgi:hypothetical protein
MPDGDRDGLIHQDIQVYRPATDGTVLDIALIRDTGIDHYFDGFPAIGTGYA